MVITGASAGIGRATAQAFGGRGARVGLLARGTTGLAGAVHDVEDAGGKAIAWATDVSDYAQVRSAARNVEDAFGPIDVWVNDAFASVFAPFSQITPEEFVRVTEVAYLGYVYGTMVALKHMRPRDRGAIVQVGSALSQRSIPLQSAYCGAKHAINGFTFSLRTELMHEGSNVKVTVVQIPAVNTPQFSWVLSRLAHSPQPVSPIYQPEVAAKGVVFAADHPGRRQYWVGGSTAATLFANKFAAGWLDRYLARTGYRAQQTDRVADPDRRYNLWEPVDGDDGDDHGAHGAFDDKARNRCLELLASQHARQLRTTVGLAALGVTGYATAPWRQKRRMPM